MIFFINKILRMFHVYLYLFVYFFACVDIVLFCVYSNVRNDDNFRWLLPIWDTRAVEHRRQYDHFFLFFGNTVILFFHSTLD